MQLAYDLEPLRIMKKLIVFASSMIAALNVQGQGCSDAGFCTAGSMHGAASTDTASVGKTGVSLTAGSGEQGTTILIPQIEWAHTIGTNTQIEVKLPFYFASGNIGEHSGLSDPTITVTKTILLNKNWTLLGTIGTRISLSNANANDDMGRPLPMPYQQGLGTTDVIAGLTLQHKNWLFVSAGYQQPLIQYNHNGYLASLGTPADKEYNAYFDSRELNRRGDVLLRADVMYSYKRWSVSGGPLFIYHLGEDRITNLAGMETSLKGSDGLTLNLTAKIGYKTKRSLWELGGGTPFVVRDNRPDGLTRAFVVTLRYAHLSFR